MAVLKRPSTAGPVFITRCPADDRTSADIEKFVSALYRLPANRPRYVGIDGLSAKNRRELNQPVKRAGKLAGAHPHRVLVLFSDIGDGHLSAARTLVEEIVAEEPDMVVSVVNGLDALGRFLRWFMRDLYRWQLSRCPRLYWFAYALFRRVWVLRALGAILLWGLSSRAVLRLVQGHTPDIVVSTDARLNVVLGHLRKTGRLRVPVFATLTDLAGLEFWAHAGVDHHLVMDPICVAPVERVAGRGSARASSGGDGLLHPTRA